MDDDSGNVKSIRPGLNELKKRLQAMQNAQRVRSREPSAGSAYPSW